MKLVMNEGDKWRFSVFCKSNVFDLKTEELGCFFWHLPTCLAYMRHNQSIHHLQRHIEVFLLIIFTEV